MIITACFQCVLIFKKLKMASLFDVYFCKAIGVVGTPKLNQFPFAGYLRWNMTYISGTSCIILFLTGFGNRGNAFLIMGIKNMGGCSSKQIVINLVVYCFCFSDLS